MSSHKVLIHLKIVGQGWSHNSVQACSQVLLQTLSLCAWGIDDTCVMLIQQRRLLGNLEVVGLSEISLYAVTLRFLWNTSEIKRSSSNYDQKYAHVLDQPVYRNHSLQDQFYLLMVFVRSRWENSTRFNNVIKTTYVSPILFWPISIMWAGSWKNRPLFSPPPWDLITVWWRQCWPIDLCLPSHSPHTSPQPSQE